MANKTAWRGVAVAVLGLSACSDVFLGDAQELRFTSTLSRGFERFDPRRHGLVVGSTIELRCDGFADGGRVDGGLPASVTVDAPELFAFVDAGPGVFRATIADAGSARLVWDAGRVDRFVLRAEPAASVVLDDPLRAIAEPLSAGVLWPAPGRDIAVALGQALSLEVSASGADGGALVFSTDLLTLDVTATGRLVNGAVLLEVPDAGLAPTVVGVRLGGQRLGDVTVSGVSPARVIRVDLAARQVGDTLFVKATSFLDGGQVLWLPPVTWAIDARLERVDAGFERGDVIALRAKAGSAFPADASVHLEADVGPAIGVQDVPFMGPASSGDGGEAPLGAGPTRTRDFVPLCGCSTGVTPLAVAWALAAVLARRRRPRRAVAPESSRSTRVSVP